MNLEIAAIDATRSCKMTHGIDLISLHPGECRSVNLSLYWCILALWYHSAMRGAGCAILGSLVFVITVSIWLSSEIHCLLSTPQNQPY